MLVLENLSQNPYSYQKRIITIIRNQVIKQAVGKKEKNSKIIAISNRYKDTLEDFIDSSNPKALPEIIDERFHNVARFRDSSTSLLEKNCLNKDVLALEKLSQVVAKIKNPQFHQYRHAATFDSKNKRV